MAKRNNNNANTNKGNSKDKDVNKDNGKAPIRISFDDHESKHDSSKDKEIKVNKYNSGGVKQAIDDIICGFLLEITGHEENNNVTNLRIVLSFIGCVVAVAAQFHTYLIKFNVPLIVVCVSIYALISLVLAYVLKYKVSDTIIIVKSDKFLSGLKSDDNSVDDEIVVSSDIEEYDTKYKVTFADRGKSLENVTTLSKEFDTTAWIDTNGVVHREIVENDFKRFFEEYLKQKIRGYKTKSE